LRGKDPGCQKDDFVYAANVPRGWIEQVTIRKR